MQKDKKKEQEKTEKELEINEKKLKLQKKEIPEAFVFSVDKGLPFQIRKTGISAISEFEKANAILQKLLRRLEKRFKDVIWYIGTDIFDSGIYERFVFNSGGFMEIRIGSSPSLEVYFTSEKRVIDFKRALAKAISDIKK